MLKFESIVKIDDPYNSANNKLSVFISFHFIFPKFSLLLFRIEKLQPGAYLTQDLFNLPFFYNYHWIELYFISFIIMWKIKKVVVFHLSSFFNCHLLLRFKSENSSRGLTKHWSMLDVWLHHYAIWKLKVFFSFCFINET